MKVLLRKAACWLVCLCAIPALADPSGADGEGTAPPAPSVVEILLHDTLQPISAAMLRNELAAANRLDPAAILLNLSTPGGVQESAIAMAQMIRTSAAPVIVYVREPNSRVQGEGLRLLAAGAARVMHPETALLPLSREHVRTLPWGSREGEIADLSKAVATDLRRNGGDPASLQYSLESTVSISPAEALGSGLVNTERETESAALQALNGLPVRFADGSVRPLAVAGARIQDIPLTPVQHVLRAMMNPDLTVLFLTLGALLIFLEMNTPGGVVPGAAGLLLVLLALYALYRMPLRWEGGAMLCLSTGMLFAETHFQRGKAFAIGAMVCLAIGLRWLVRAPIPEMQVGWGTAIGAGVGFGGITAGLLLMGVRARRAKTRTGAEAMLGWLAIAQTSLSPMGEVLVRGELWRATLSAGNTFLSAGECVKVQSYDGTLLEVAPMPLTQHADAAS